MNFRIKMGLVLFGLSVALSPLGCTPKPTKTRETRRNPIVKSASAKEDKAKWLDKVQKDECALLDARTLYEFQLKRVPGSVHMRWQDFADQGAKFKGTLSKDLEGMANRLALIGVHPDRCAVIFTDQNSTGEDGRIAWTLAYLGVRQIQILNREEYPELFIGPLDKGVKNSPYWKPATREELRTTPAQFLAIAPSTTRALDVRTAQERRVAPLSPNMSSHAINIPAADFYNGQKFKNEMIWELEKEGVRKDQKLVVISRDGVAGAGDADRVAPDLRPRRQAVRAGEHRHGFRRQCQPGDPPRGRRGR